MMCCKVYLLFCLGFYYAEKVISEYYVNDTLTYTETLDPPCQLAEPKIIYTGNLLTVKIPAANIEENGEMWIGYMKTLSVFDYIDCVSENDIRPYTNIKYPTPADIGQCFSACGTRYFGVNTDTCYCITANVYSLNNKRDTCYDSCDKPSGTACGGKGSVVTYVSLYRKGTAQTHLKDDGNDCGTFRSNSQTLVWSRCNIPQPGRARRGLCQNGTPLSYWQIWSSRTWIYYTQTCFKKNYNPAVDYTSRLSDISNDDLLWVGKITSWIIVNTRDSSPNYSNYGYISKDGDVYQLKFSKTKKHRKALCVYGDRSKTTTDPNTTEDISDATVDYLAGRDDITNEKSKSGLVAVYVGVPLVLIAIVAVLLLIIRWKRNRSHQKGTQSTYSEHTGGDQQPGIRDAVTNAAYDKTFVANPTEPGSEEPEYFALEYPNEYATIQDRITEYKCDEDYDTTNDIGKQKLTAPVDGNVYNTLSEQLDDAYNHTGHNVGNSAEFAVTPSGNPNIDTTYSHAVKDDEYGSTTENQTQFDHTYNRANYGGFQ